MYTIYQSMNEYQIYGEIGIAIALTVIQGIIDLNVADIFNKNAGSLSMDNLISIG